MAFEPFGQIFRALQSKRFTGQISEVNSLQQAAYLRNLQKKMRAVNSLSMHLNDLTYVVFDLETTGFRPHKGDEILSIGAIKMQGHEILQEETFYTLVKPTKRIPQNIVQLTKITELQTENAPICSNGLMQFFEFAQDATLVAHHANHERKFMKYYSETLLKVPFQHRLVDTSFLINIVNESAQMYTLDDLCIRHNIEIENRHHALGDAKMTACIWQIYLQQAMDKGCDSLQNMYERFSKYV